MRIKKKKKTITNLKAPTGFTYRSVDSQVVVTVKGGIPGAEFDILNTIPEENEEPIVLATGRIGTDRTATVTVKGTNADTKTLFVRSKYITMPSAQVTVANGAATLDYTVIADAADAPKTSIKGKGKESTRIIKNGFDCVLDYDSWGIPYRTETGMVTQNLDKLYPGLVKRLNNAFPEGRAISSLGTGDIKLLPGNIKNDFEVKITVIHEGAGYKNTLGYYTYTEGNAPKSVADIKDIKVVFPNFETGYLNKVGGNVLKTGDTVTLPVKFSKDTYIGFVVLQDGWKQSQGKIDPNSVKFYTNSALNSDGLQHTAAFFDMHSMKTVIGMEDLTGGGDRDYNDIMVMMNVKVDDKIIDETIVRETIERYPASGSNTLVYEDLWPSKGDYDFNDQVINFNYALKSTKTVRTLTNETTGEVIKLEETNYLNSLTLNYTLKAAGAGVQSGLGIVLPINPSLIASVTGQNITKQWPLSIASNGVENGTKENESVILVYDNAKRVLAGTDLIEFVNTVPGETYFAPVSGTITITFKDATDFYALARNFPFNPFIYRSYERGLEVHLSGQAPTSLANLSKFYTADDTSIVGSRYYVNAENLPWALEIPANFKYPKEQTDIVKAYPKFYNWVVTGGTEDTEWYNYPTTGKIYE